MTRRYTGGFLSATEQATDANSANGIYTLSDAAALTAAGNFPDGRWTPSRSLRFRSSGTVISRTAAVASNRRTWTFSCWFKPGIIDTGNFRSIMEAFTGANDTYCAIAYNNANIWLTQDNGAGGVMTIYTNAAYRDPAAWYHLVVAVDTTNAVEANRVRIYINGSQQALTASMPAQNLDTWVNSANPMRIGGRWSLGSSGMWDGYLSEVYLIDGQQLTPSYFASTDPETGTWVPKQFGYPSYSRYAATAGMITNSGFGGFSAANLVDYNPNSAAFFADSSGIGSTITWDLGAGNAKEFRKVGILVNKSTSTGLKLACVVEYSDNNSTWTTVSNTINTLTEGGQYGAGETFQIGAKWGSVGAHRYWRIYKTDTAAGGDYCNGIDFYEQTNDNSSVAYGENGFYLDFSDNSSTSVNWAAGADRSGNENNFRTVAHTFGVDMLVDVPGVASVSSQVDVGGVTRGNYCIWNPLQKGSNPYVTVSDGNLKVVGNTATNSGMVLGTMSFTSGKYYWEITATVVSSDVIGIATRDPGTFPDSYFNNTESNTANFGYGLRYNGSVYGISGELLQGSAFSYTTSDIIGVAVDADNGALYFSKNGVWQFSGNPLSGAAKTGAFAVWPVGPSRPVTPFQGGYNSGTTVANFGQRAFNSTPPVGYKTLNTTNLPNPVIKRPEEHFKAKTYIGNGAGQQIGVVAKESSAYPIESSLKFNTSTSGHLTRTPATASNRKTWSYSAWIKRSVLGTRQSIFSAGTGNLSSAPGGGFYFTSSTNKIEYVMGGGTSCLVTTSQMFTNTAAWFHLLVVMDTTQLVPQQRLKMYVDGVQVQLFDNTTYPSLNFDTDVNNNVIHAIGSRTDDGALPNTLANYYLAEVNFIDGSAKVPSDFGAYDANNNWVPQRYTGTYGTNGFYLPIKQSGGTGFNAVTWTGNSTINKISGVGFSPDLVWFKTRSTSNNHTLVDTIRGVNAYLFSTVTTAEQTSPDGVQSFDSDGFTLNNTGSGGNVNVSGRNYVAWCWDAGTSTVSNTSGSVNSTVRANPTNGFSIVTWNTPAAGNYTVGHGLGTAPSMIIIKGRNDTNNWLIGHTSIGWTKYLHFLTNGAATAARFADTAPTSSVFTLGGAFMTTGAGAGATHVAYCFSEVAGFSKFGTYTGNGSSTGPTITLGFRPAFVMVKRTDTTGNWVMFDSTRSNTNTRSNAVSADLVDREYGSADGVVGIDFTATGFQLRDTHTTRNENAGTYIYMAFAETRANIFGKDNSTNGNDWQPGQGVGTATDIVLDSPADTANSSGNIVGNYATISSTNIPTNGSFTVANGGLSVVSTSDANRNHAHATLSVNTGKWYWEVTRVSGDRCQAGVARITSNRNEYVGHDANGWGIYQLDGNSYHNQTTAGTSYGSSWGSDGDILMIALDMDTSKIWFGKNGTWFASGNPQTGASPAFSNVTGEIYPAIGDGSGGGQFSAILNFGQLPFQYTPPTGFNALNSKNLKDVGSFNLPDSFGNFVTSPDLVIVKRRNSSNSHLWADSVRGNSRVLLSNDTGVQLTDQAYQTFLQNGFGLSSSNNESNASGAPYMSWNWNRGKIPGFEILTYPGTGAVQRIRHNLGQTPAVVLVKGINYAQNWLMYHKDLGPTKWMQLNTTAAVLTETAIWNNTAPTNVDFTVGTSSALNGSGNSSVAYLWAEVPGFSKFGTYTGNGSTDGPFIHLGFRPAFVLSKRTDTTLQQWNVWDTARSTFNPMRINFWFDSSEAEIEADGYAIDAVSNGFKLRNSHAGRNASGGTYIYMAFAESPFKYANAR